MFSKSHTKYIQSLHHKKFRDEEGLFFAEGPKVVADLMASTHIKCKEIFALPVWLNANEQLVAAKQIDEVYEVADFELEKISALTTPNQVLAVFEKKIVNNNCKLTGKITLALDTIQDPGNLGTIIRIADWFGIENIICSHGCAYEYNPEVVHGTMGSIARVNIIYTEVSEWLKENSHIKIYAAALNGLPVQSFETMKEGILIIGNESKGISDEIFELVNEKITIPKLGKAESLNAAVATGILLSHLCTT